MHSTEISLLTVERERENQGDITRQKSSPGLQHTVQLSEEGRVKEIVRLALGVEVHQDVVPGNHRLHHMDEIRHGLGGKDTMTQPLTSTKIHVAHL